GNNGSIRATFGGGTAPYQVKIDNGSYTTQSSPYTFTGLAPGSHTVTLNDANGCTTPASISVASCPRFCTLTQGAYGNPGGKYNYNGHKLGTTALLQRWTLPSHSSSIFGGGLGTLSLAIP